MLWVNAMNKIIIITMMILLMMVSFASAITTGGTITSDGNYVIHTFTSNGIFTTDETINVEVLVVGAGGGASAGTNTRSGAGGAGGTVDYDSNYSVSSSITVTIGVGGAGAAYNGAAPTTPGTGGSSVFGTITATGGSGTAYSASIGGSNADYSGGSSTGGTYNGGGAGAGGNGEAGSAGNSGGGIGYTSSITGTSIMYAGGGAGGYNCDSIGGGGAFDSSANHSITDGDANTGGGGGATGGPYPHVGGIGGSGVVIIRYLKTYNSSYTIIPNATSSLALAVNGTEGFCGYNIWTNASTNLTLQYNTCTDFTIRDVDNNTVPYEVEQLGTGYLTSSVYDSDATLVYHFGNENLTANDSTSNGNDGTVTGATYTTDGMFGGAMSFDGTDDKITINTLYPFSNTDATLSFWFKDTKSTGSSSLINRRIDGNNVWTITHDPDTLGYGMMIRGAIGGNWNFNPSTTLSNNEWHNIVITKDGNDFMWYSDNINVYNLTMGDFSTISSNLQLGYLDGANELEGQIDEVRIYSKTLTSQEINDSYENGMNENMLFEAAGPAPPTEYDVTVYRPENNSIQYNSTLDVLFYYGLNTTCYLDINGSYYDDLPNNNLVNSTFAYTFPDYKEYNFTVRCLNSSLNVTHFITYAEYPNFNETPTTTTLEYGIEFLNITFNGSASLTPINYFINDTTNFKIGLTDGVLENNTLLSIGNYYINISINDTNGAVNSTTYEVIVNDSLAPQWTVIPDNISMVEYSGNIEVTFTATDVDTVTYYVSDDSNFSMDINTGVLTNATALPYGFYDIVITANDTSGNFNTTGYMVWIQAPIIVNITYPENNNYYSGTDFNISYDTYHISYIQYNVTCELFDDNVSVGTRTKQPISSLGAGLEYFDPPTSVYDLYDGNYSSYGDMMLDGEYNVVLEFSNITKYLEYKSGNGTKTLYTIPDGCLVDDTYVLHIELFRDMPVITETWGRVIFCQAEVGIPPTYIIEGPIVSTNSYDDDMYEFAIFDETEFFNNYSTSYQQHDLDLVCYGDNNQTLNYTDSITFYTDSEAPQWTYIPANATLVYGEDSLDVDFNATDGDPTFTYGRDDGRFDIDPMTGQLTNNTFLPYGIIYVNVTAEDGAGNINWTIYEVKVYNHVPTINITYPLENEHINSTNIIFTFDIDVSPDYILNITENTNCSLYIDDTYMSSNLTTSTGSINEIVPEGEHDYYINCTRLDTASLGFYNSSPVRNFTIDITLPTMTSGNGDLSNRTYTTSTTLSNFTASDAYLLLCYINATCSDGTNIYSYQHLFANGTTSAVVNDTINNSLCGEKNFVNVLRQCADTHTNDKIDKVKIIKDIKKGELKLKSKKDKYLTVKTDKKIKDIKIKERLDRVSFTFVPEDNVNKDYMDFSVEGENIIYIPNTKYKGHFVEWTGFNTNENNVPESRWIDFENTNGYEVEYLGGNTVRIFCGEDNCNQPIEFNSYGSLNINEESFTYWYNLIDTINTTETFTSPLVVNFSTTYKMNITYFNDILFPTNWTWDSSFTEPTAILELYGTNITQNYTATSTSLYTVETIESSYDYEIIEIVDDTFTNVYVYINYSKPFANDFALWRVKHGMDDYNISIPEYCMQDIIQLQMHSYSLIAGTNYGSEVKCKSTNETWFNIGKQYYGYNDSVFINYDFTGTGLMVDGNYSTGVLMRTLGVYSTGNNTEYGHIYEQGPMYFGDKNMQFSTTITVPNINNTYNYTSHKWHVIMENSTNENVTLNTDEQNQTVYQAIINLKFINIESGAALTGLNLNITSLLTGNSYYNNDTTSKYTTFYLTALNHSIYVSGNGYDSTTFYEVWPYGSNTTYIYGLNYTTNFLLLDESTFGLFNVSSPERIQFTLFCNDGVTEVSTINETVFNYTIGCDYIKYNFILEWEDGTTYYRTFIGDEGPGVNNSIYLIDVATTSYIANTFTIDDLLTKYENVSIWVKRNILGTNEIITSDFIDVEQKIATWLMTNREYTIEVHSSNNPIKVIGAYTASTTGNKAIKLYDITLLNPPVTYDANVVYGIQSETNHTDNESLLHFVYEDYEGLTNNVTFELFNNSEMITPFATYTSTANEVSYTFNSTNLVNENIYGKIASVRNGTEHEYVSVLYQATIFGRAFVKYMGKNVLNWFFIILLSTISIFASVSTANYMGLVICGVGLMTAIFGWFGLSFGLIGFGIVVAVISLFSKANKGAE